MRGWLGLGFVTLLGGFVACGGAAEQTDLFGSSGGASGASGSGGTSGIGTPTTPTATATSTSTTPPPTPTTPPCSTTYYRDRDGDGVGGTETKVACDAPGKDWVEKGGDCDDDDDRVFPGQTTFFATPYSAPGGGQSFDYDCSKKEEQAPPPKKAATTCTLVGGACNGSGFVPTPRPAPGSDPLCGATKFQTCRLAVGGPPGCETILSTVESPVACR
ncbi:MAG: hypothetical protein JST00_19195 [Deltaproteobacteria bacterium]|nr:hypothetical protein [Deltaproteobacteria bacterium]